MKRYAWVVLTVSGMSVAWCIAMAVAIARTPLWRQGAVQGAVLVPIALAALATWAASRRSRFGVIGSTMFLVAFTVVTGFSIGNAYIPAAGLLIVASLLAAFPGFSTVR